MNKSLGAIIKLVVSGCWFGDEHKSGNFKKNHLWNILILQTTYYKPLTNYENLYKNGR